MRKILLFAIWPLIALIYSCNLEPVIDTPVGQEKGEVTDKVITITAMMPGENNENALGENTKTRIGLEQDAGGNVHLTWKPGDKLDILLIDGSNVILRPGIEVTDIDDTGKSAKFEVHASGVTGSKIGIYGIYGGGGLDPDNPALARLPSAMKSIGGTLEELEKSMMLRFAVPEVDMANPAATLSSVAFEHVGSLFSIQVNNAGPTGLTGIKKARLVSTSTDPNHHIGAYINSGGMATYNTITGKIAGATTGNTLPFEIPEATDLASTSGGSSLSFWGWYIPTADDWPGITLELLDSSDKVLRTTVDNKPPQNTATAVGKAFYFRSFLNVSRLSFAEVASVQSAVDLAIWLSFPLYGNGTAAHPESYVNREGATGNDVAQANPAYLQARLDAFEIAKAAGNPLLPEVNKNKRYAHCSQFIQTVIVNTIDPLFPYDTRTQIAYMNSHSRGWIKVGTSTDYTPLDYKPGDIFLTLVPGHVFMWIGEYGGHSDVICDASVSGRLPGLRRSYINPETGLDPYKRQYDIWRFIGKDGEDGPGPTLSDFYGEDWSAVGNEDIQ